MIFSECLKMYFEQKSVIITFFMNLNVGFSDCLMVILLRMFANIVPFTTSSYGNI